MSDPEIVYVVHRNPAIRLPNYYIAQVDLAPFDLPGQQEQVWLRELPDGSYEMACIPFCVYGVALGDRVSLTPEGLVASLIERSGHRVFRILFTPSLDEPDLTRMRADIEAWASAADRLVEWHGERFVAVDVPIGADVDGVWAVVEPAASQRHLYYEWADVKPFVAS